MAWTKVHWPAEIATGAYRQKMLDHCIMLLKNLGLAIAPRRAFDNAANSAVEALGSRLFAADPPRAEAGIQGGSNSFEVNST